MACYEMYNSSPRISFSYDFVDPHHQFSNRPSQSPPPPLPPASSDFEFSVSIPNQVCPDMICADEVFSKGKLLPHKYTKSSAVSGAGGTTTLRDELLTGHEEGEGTKTVTASSGSFWKPPKSSGARWKGFLGLRRSHIGSKKPEKTDDGSVGSRGVMSQGQAKHLDFEHDIFYNNTSQQEMASDGRSSSRYLEIGI